jgi:hypothetical protein
MAQYEPEALATDESGKRTAQYEPEALATDESGKRMAQYEPEALATDEMLACHCPRRRSYWRAVPRADFERSVISHHEG